MRQRAAHEAKCQEGSKFPGSILFLLLGHKNEKVHTQNCVSLKAVGCWLNERQDSLEKKEGSAATANLVPV